MIQFPTFAELRGRLVDEVGCKYSQLPGSLSIDDGEPKPICYFEREAGGEMRRYAVAIPDDERLAPSVIRSICKRLAVDPAIFGLTLG